MTKLIELDIVSAESSIFNGEVRFIAVSGRDGELGIHPGHSALLTPLKPGQIKAILKDGKEEIFYMSGGMLEVQPTVVSILADSALRADDLDEAAAQEAKKKAEKILQEKTTGMEYSRALSELAEAAAQLRAISMLRDKIKNVH